MIGMEHVRDGLLAGLLRAERELREMAEERARELSRVLMEVAARVDGAVMEEHRRRDPRAPESWGAEEWRRFFARVLEPRWMAASPAEAERVRALQARIAELEEEVRRLRAQLAERAPAPVEASREAPVKASTDRELYDPYHDLVFPDLPIAPPPRFEALRPRWRRAAMAVFAVASGMSVRQEVLDRIARVEGIGPKSGSLKRLIESLSEEGFLRARTLFLPLGGMANHIVAVELGEKGKALAEVMGWEIREGDWARLRRLHQGEDLEAHTAAVLVFLYQARVRGWRAMAMPSVEGPAAPDAVVERDGERFYVEVERSGEEKPEKWRNLAALQGRVALCAPTPELRSRLAADCRTMGLRGVATDLLSLLQSHEDLWIERW
ncbi:MAG: hypothetical protein QN194_15390 [Armatimonadota bacterium]|nr:hypothetical protein [Armatimonadota bacterium]